MVQYMNYITILGGIEQWKYVYMVILMESPENNGALVGLVLKNMTPEPPPLLVVHFSRHGFVFQEAFRKFVAMSTRLTGKKWDQGNGEFFRFVLPLLPETKMGS